MIRALRGFFVILLMLLVQPIFSQWDLKYYTTGKGNELPSNTVYDIFQSAEGKVYIGHELGLSVYNGIQIAHFSFEGESSPLRNLIQLDEHRILCSNFYDHVFIADDRNLKVTKIDSLSKKQRGFSEFFKYKNQVYRMQDDKLILLFQDTIVLNKVVLQSKTKAQFFDGQLTDDFIFVKDGVDFLGYHLPSGKVTIHSEVPFRQGYVFILKHKGDYLVYHPNTNSLIPFGTAKHDFPKSLPGYDIQDKLTWIIDRKDGGYFICSFGGLYLYNENLEFEGKYFSRFDLSAIYESNEGSLLLGTLHDGMLIIPSLKIRSLSAERILNRFENISKVAVESDTSLIIGTYRGRVLRCSANGEITAQFDVQSRNEVQSIQVSKSSIYLFCKDFIQLDPVRLKLKSSSYTNPAKAILALSGDSIAIASSRGIELIPPSAPHVVEFPNIWFTDVFSSGKYLLAQSSSGILFIDRYTLNIQNEKLFTVNHQDLLREGGNLSACGDVFYFSRKNQIYAINSNFGIEKKMDCPVDRIFDLICIGPDLLVSDGKSILRFDGTIWHSYDRLHGLDFENIIALHNWNEKLLVVEKNGLLIFDEYPKLNVVPPIVRLKRMGGSFKETNRNLQSDFYSNELLLQFEVLPNLKSAGNDTLFYKIHGIDSTWKFLTGAQRYLLSESRLPHGTFKLEYFAVNESGISSAHQFLSLVILTPVYLKPWFIGLCFIGFLFILWFIVRWRIALIRRKNKEAIDREILKIRTLQAELKALRSQMNPHFIFNTLSVIQSQVVDGDNQSAYKNLSLFSTLLRRSLELTRQEVITLKEEMEFIEKYMALEKNRFNDAFRFEIQFNDPIDPSHRFIPSLITQPLIENAIHHGILPERKSDSLIEIIINGKSEKKYEILIRDNGIGRKRSAEINSSKTGKPASFATSAIAERIQFLTENYQCSISIEYTDLQRGTSVCLTIQGLEPHHA